MAEGLSAESVAAAGPLSGTSWTLVELRGRSLDPPPARGAPTLRFTLDRAAGFAGCNRYFATYRVQGAEIRFGEIGATRMACTGDDSMMLEQQYIDALHAVDRWERSGSTLTLRSGDRVVARFRRGADDDAGP